MIFGLLNGLSTSWGCPPVGKSEDYFFFLGPVKQIQGLVTAEGCIQANPADDLQAAGHGFPKYLALGILNGG